MLGLREAKKFEKRRRIVDATNALLAEKGFDQMTTREIARRAGVGTGTLFRYGHDKLDLCIMSITDDRDQHSSAFERFDDRAPLLDQIKGFFEHRFRFWARHPEVSRLATHIMASPAGTGPELARTAQRQDQTLSKLKQMLRQQQCLGVLKAEADPALLAQMAFYIYVGTLRHWLTATHPKPSAGIRMFMKLVTAAMEGSLEPTAATKGNRTAQKSPPFSANAIRRISDSD